MTQIAVAYGEALYSLCAEEGITSDIRTQLLQLRQLLEQEEQFLRLLTASNLSRQERISIVDKCFRDRAHPYVLNFLKLLTEKGHARHFCACVTVFEDTYNKDNGILPVQAVSAVPLTEAQTKRLEEKLSAITGKKAAITNRVDPSCLGGLRLDYDGTRVDGSVASRMATIGKLLKSTVL